MCYGCIISVKSFTLHNFIRLFKSFIRDSYTFSIITLLYCMNFMNYRLFKICGFISSYNSFRLHGFIKYDESFIRNGYIRSDKSFEIFGFICLHDSFGLHDFLWILNHLYFMVTFTYNNSF